MKKLYIIASLMPLLGLLSSCQKEDRFIGDWDPIQLNREFKEIPAEGGTDSIWTTNYPEIWLNYGKQEYDARIPEQDLDTLANPSVEDGFAPREIYHLKGKWICLYVPESNKKAIVVKVSPNTSGVERRYKIDVQYGDAFSHIIVKQAAK